MTGPRPKRAIIYTRVSRDDSGEAKSNQRQEDDCRAFAQARGYDVVGVEADVSFSAYSGKTRPAWTRVMDSVRSGEVDVVLAWKVDRITRTVRELVSIIDVFRENDVSVVTIDGELDLATPQGRAVATILGSISQMEVERKGERQRAANAQRRAEGEPWRSGWASFGYDRDKNVIPEQAEMIRQAADDVLRGHSLKSIARRWRDSGVTTPRSSKGAAGWTHNGVKAILLNPVNAGINTYRGQEIGRGSWEPILSEGTLRQLQALLGDPARRTRTPSGRAAENLLSGIARCGRCDHPVVAGVSNGKKVYKCANPAGEHLSTPREDADQFVLNALIANPMFASHSVLPDAAAREEHDLVLSELDQLDLREQKITEQFSRDTIRVETWTAAMESIKEQRESLQSRLAEADGEVRSEVARAQARVDNFMTLSLGQKRSSLAALVKIELHPRNRRRKVPVSDQVTVWARDERRLSPLIAGTRPESLKRAQAHIEGREVKIIDALGSDWTAVS